MAAEIAAVWLGALNRLTLQLTTMEDWFYMIAVIIGVILIGEWRGGAIQALLGLLMVIFGIIGVLPWGNIWVTLIVLIVGVSSMIRSVMSSDWEIFAE